MTKSEIDALIARLTTMVDARTPSEVIYIMNQAAAALRSQQEEIERLTHLINIDWDCLPTCNSFGHDPECPYCNGEPKLRLLVERAERLAEQVKSLGGTPCA